MARHHSGITTVVFAVAGFSIGIVLIAAVVSPAPGLADPAASLSGIQGAGTSAVLLQNLDLLEAVNITAEFQSNLPRGEDLSLQIPSLPPSSTHLIWMNTEQALSPGDYALRFGSDRAIGAVAWTSWATSHAAIMHNATEPSEDLLVPVVVHEHDGEGTAIFIQNTDPGQPARVDIQVYNAARPGSPSTMQMEIDAGGSSWLSFMFGGPADLLPAGASGWARIRGDRPLTATVIGDLADSRTGSYATSGIPADWAAPTLFAPSIHSAAEVDVFDRSRQLVDSEVVVIAPGGQEMEIHVDLEARPDCLVDGSTMGPFRLPADGQLRIRPSVRHGGPLSETCIAAATIRSDGPPIVATVIERSIGPAADVMAQAYDALPPRRTGQTVLLPLFRSRHTDFELSSVIYLMNAGDEEADVHIDLIDDAGTLLDCNARMCNFSIPSGGVVNWSALLGIPRGTYGRAIVTSDQPLAAVVVDASMTGDLDFVSYSGIPASNGEEAGSAFLATIAKTGQSVRIPPATLVPTPGPISGGPDRCPPPIRICPPCPQCTPTPVSAEGTPTVCPSCRPR